MHDEEIAARAITRYEQFIPYDTSSDADREIHTCDDKSLEPIRLTSGIFPAARFVLLDAMHDEAGVDEWLYQGELSSSAVALLSTRLDMKKPTVSKRISDLRLMGAIETLHSTLSEPTGMIVDLRMTARGEEYYHGILDQYPDQTGSILIHKSVTALEGEVCHAEKELGIVGLGKRIMECHKSDARACVAALTRTLNILEAKIDSRSAHGA